MLQFLLLLILENITWDLVNENANLSLGCLVCVSGWLLTSCSAIFQLREGREKVLFVGVRPIASYVRPLFAPLLEEHKGMPSSNFSKCLGTKPSPKTVRSGEMILTSNLIKKSQKWCFFATMYHIRLFVPHEDSISTFRAPIDIISYKRTVALVRYVKIVLV